MPAHNAVERADQGDAVSAVITIQEDFDGGQPMPTHHLRRGEYRSFGRGGSGSPVDIGLAAEDRAISRVAGVIESKESFWCITNASRNKTYVVEHTDVVPGYIQVQPGMRETVIPFETSRVRVPGAQREYTFLVMAPEQGPIPDRAEPRGEGPPTGIDTDVTYRLDHWNTYFRVLVAFCEPQLRDPTSSELPTQPHVASRLGLNRSAVSAHIDYLLHQKLKIGSQIRSRGDRRQQVLAEYALRFGLVTPADLQLLPMASRSRTDITPPNMGPEQVNRAG